MLTEDAGYYNNYVMRYVRAAASLDIKEYDKKEVRCAINMLLGLVITTGEVHKLTGQLDRVAEWIICRQSELVAFTAMKVARSRYHVEASPEHQGVLFKWRMIMDEDELSVSHLSEGGRQGRGGVSMRSRARWS